MRENIRLVSLKKSIPPACIWVACEIAATLSLWGGISFFHGSADIATHIGMNSVEIHDPKSPFRVRRIKDTLWHLWAKIWSHEVIAAFSDCSHEHQLYSRQTATILLACLSGEQLYKSRQQLLTFYSSKKLVWKSPS